MKCKKFAKTTAAETASADTALNPTEKILLKAVDLVCHGLCWQAEEVLKLLTDDELAEVWTIFTNVVSWNLEKEANSRCEVFDDIIIIRPQDPGVLRVIKRFNTVVQIINRITDKKYHEAFVEPMIAGVFRFDQPSMQDAGMTEERFRNIVKTLLSCSFDYMQKLIVDIPESERVAIQQTFLRSYGDFLATAQLTFLDSPECLIRIEFDKHK